MKQGRKAGSSRQSSPGAAPPAAERKRRRGADPAEPPPRTAAEEADELGLELDDVEDPSLETEEGIAPATEASVRRPDPAGYDEIRRLLAGMFREAAGLPEAQESVCGILYEELDHYSWVGIYMVDGDELELAAWAGPEETEHARIRIGEGICGLAAETGETEIVPDVTQNERFIACFPSTRSEIVVPLLKDGEVVGEIDVDSDLLDAFDDRDVRLLEWTAAKLAALA